MLLPRRPRFYILPAAYCLGLLILIATAWLILAGTQVVDTVGTLALFGASMFSILAPLQLVVTVFFGAISAASSVAQEKDRHTLDLLLMTRLTNAELVLGKLLSSQLMVLVLVVAGFPIFVMLTLFGGVAFDQILRTALVTVASILVAGSIGTIVGFWREKTFQAVAGTILGLVLWVGAGEVLAAGLAREGLFGLVGEELAALVSPWHAILRASQPIVAPTSSRGLLGLRSFWGFLGTSLVFVALLNILAIVNVRRWTKANEPRPILPEPEGPSRLISEGTGPGEGSAGGIKSPNPELAEGTVVLTSSDCGLGPQKSTTASAVDPSGGMANGRTCSGNRGDTGVAGLSAESPISIAASSRPAAWRWARPFAAEGEGEDVLSADQRPWWLDLLLPPGKRTFRHVWSNPVLWREMCTRAYGRRMLVLRLGYVVIFFAIAWLVVGMLQAGTLSAYGLGGLAMAALFLLSLVLVNAQAVSSLISERDGRTLDLLLVTDITPKEFVLGKMFGTFFNIKEMVLLPLALCVYLWWRGAIVGLELFYLVAGLCVLYGFVAMLGLHVGMNYGSSHHAIAISLGTVFFLFVGVATCIWMMVAFGGRFEAQLPFLGLIVFGGAALYLALGVRNPSSAIGVASFACPLMTFYAITSFFLQQPHLVFVTIVSGYGFATAAMLIPAIDEFDVVTGRTTVEE